MTRGTRVITPQGTGVVAYVRMAGPSYITPEAVSVVLDSKRNFPSYCGTVFAAKDVKVVDEEAPPA